MPSDELMNRRRFLKGTGGVLTLGTGVGVASQTGSAASLNKNYKWEIEPLSSETTFDVSFQSDVDPEVEEGFCNTYGSTISGSVSSHGWTDRVVFGTNHYNLESIEVGDGPLVIGAQWIDGYDDPHEVAAPIRNPPRFTDIEISGHGRYVVGIPYEEGVEVRQMTEYGDVWSVGDTTETGISEFAGLGNWRQEETTSFPIFPGPSGNTTSIDFVSQDGTIALDYDENESLEERFSPSSENDPLSSRMDPHPGVGVVGVVEGGVDQYQTAGFEKDPATWFSTVDLEKPDPQVPTWMLLDDGVEVEISHTRTDRDCPWV